MGIVIRVEHLKKYYKEVKAVDDVSLNIDEGEIFGIVGPNGAGKSTIVHLLTGQIKPDSGTIMVLGIDVEKNPEEARKNAGIIPEQEVPPSFLNSEEYLNFVSEIRKLDNSEEAKKQWFELLEYADESKKLTKDLSRGTRQKLMITQAFFFRPKIAFIDEPLVNLDPLIQRKVRKFLKGYAKKGNTILLCTHVLSLAEEICDRVGFMKQGKILHIDSVKSLVKKYGSLEKAFVRIVK